MDVYTLLATLLEQVQVSVIKLHTHSAEVAERTEFAPNFANVNNTDQCSYTE